MLDPLRFTEERGEVVELLPRPSVERVIVALGARDADAHEDLSDDAGEGHGVGVVAEDEAGFRVAVGAARGGDELAGELVERHVRANGFVHVGLEGGAAVGAVAEAEHVAVEDRPAIRELFAAHELGDGQRPPFANRPSQVLLSFRFRRDAAVQIDGNAAEERQVFDDRCGLRLGLRTVLLSEEFIECLGRDAGVWRGSGYGQCEQGEGPERHRD